MIGARSQAGAAVSRQRKHPVRGRLQQHRKAAASGTTCGGGRCAGRAVSAEAAWQDRQPSNVPEALPVVISPEEGAVGGAGAAHGAPHKDLSRGGGWGEWVDGWGGGCSTGVKRQQLGR